MLPLALLDPSPWNRQLDDDPGLAGLADSIRAEGILQELVARPVGERFQLLFGHRRRLAAAIAGLTLVPVRIRSGISDQRAKEIALAENLHRRNLHFLEEAEMVADLLRGSSQGALAARLGRPRLWIGRRARLATLSQRWRELIRNPATFAFRWTAEHCEEIALLEPEAQDQLLDTCPHLLNSLSLTADELARILGKRRNAIASFPWKASDADLDPQAGPCTSCPARSSRHPTLFDESDLGAAPAGRGRVDRSDRCLNPACAQRKLQRFLEREHARLATRHSTVLRVADSAAPTPAGAVPEWRLEPVKSAAAGAVPGLVVTGPHAGAVRWYKEPAAPPVPPATHKVGGKRSLADRKSQRQRQRRTQAIGTLQDAIRQAPPPSLTVLVALAVIFGTHQVHRRSDEERDAVLHHLLARLAGGPAAAQAGEPAAILRDTGAPRPDADDDETDGEELADFLSPPLDLWQAFDQMAGAPHATVQHFLWKRLMPVLLLRMTPDDVPAHVDTAWREAVRTAGLLGIDTDVHLQRATAALPDPKSWAREERLAAAAALSRPAVPDPRDLPAADHEDPPAAA